MGCWCGCVASVRVGTTAGGLLHLESGIALYESKDFKRARDAFVDAANTGVGRVRRDALTWLLAVSNQWLWYNDMLDAADGLLADDALPPEERARAWYSRARALQLMWVPEESLKAAQAIVDRHADTQYLTQAKDLIQQVEAKMKKEAAERERERLLGHQSPKAPAQSRPGSPPPTPCSSASPAPPVASPKPLVPKDEEF